MAGRINPGHYHLPLPFNNRDLNKDAIKKKLDDIESDLEARKGRTEDFAILNIIGLLKYRLERYKEAEKDFRAILSQDSCNLNALANMQFLLKKVYRKEEGGIFQSKLNAYLSESTEDSIRMKARCLAEQAYAYACDMHTDNAGRERYTESSDIFQKALDLGGDLIDAAEIDIWKFCMAKNAHKLFDKFTYGEDYP
ncbi:tetratricopeptide repeat protein 22-like [Acanthaster planci]|uniref:Tetratricopeptide repeat protein 22-like n=1 Tax=Acanthaster planci TaxID=133434 RepID=A0A8B7ZFU0_ACAPL|nr:tetratricopeptide repeat protein 22-like [Acanthaster planci]